MKPSYQKSDFDTKFASLVNARSTYYFKTLPEDVAIAETNLNLYNSYPGNTATFE